MSRLKDCLVILVLCLSATAAERKPVSRIADLRHLIQQDAEGVPFDLLATIAMPGTSESLPFFIVDRTGVTAIDTKSCMSNALSSASGDRVRVVGTTRRDDFGHVLANCSEITVVSHGEIPPFHDVTAAELAGEEDVRRLVRITGIVQGGFIDEIDPAIALLILNCRGDVVYVAVYATGLSMPMESLFGATVSVSGCTYDKSGSRIMLGPHILSSGGPLLHIDRTPEENAANATNLTALHVKHPSELARVGLVRVRGQVKAVWSQRRFLLQTPAGEFVRVEQARGPLPRPGETVEATGFPDTDLFRINLSTAFWTPARIPGGAAEQTVVLTARELYTDHRGRPRVYPKFHGHTIRIEGIVHGMPNPNATDKILTIKSEDLLVPVDISSLDQLPSDVSVGSTLSVSGICIMETGRWQSSCALPRIENVMIVPRSAEDLVILKHPPWWTTRRLTAVIGALLAALVCILLWNISLRKFAARKGRELFKEQLGHVKADLRTEERTRLAVELHDTLAQNLTGVSMEIEAANDLRGNAPQPMLDHLGIAAKALKSCRDELRNCLWDLRSQALEEPNLENAVLKTLQPIVNDSRLAVRFNVPRARLSDNTAHALLRVIRELVVNAIRHGNANSVRVAGAIERGKLLCSVTDDGCGFNPDAAPSVLQGHFGLQGIQERIDEIGGTFEITSTPGTGTKAVITLTAPAEEKQ